MTEIVVLAWDPDTRSLDYVEVNDGSGGVPVTLVVPADWAGPVSAELSGRGLPCTAQLETDGDDVLIDAAASHSVIRCAVKAVGSPHDPQLELRPKGGRMVLVKPSAARLGISDPRAAGPAQSFEFLYTEALTPPGCWLGAPGGIGTWLENWQAERGARGRAATADISFVNPYTFVPFPARIARSQPPGHDRLVEGMLSGTFTVCWEFTTSFQVPAGLSNTARIRLPGASVKGAVRSVHEALAGGCLRVFDDAFIPSYRDAAAVPPASWRLALVTDATRDGQPLAVQLCDEVVWVRMQQLRVACGTSLQTGSRVTIRADDVPRDPNSLGRKELGEGAVVEKDGDWIVLVTSPRPPAKKSASGPAQAGAYFLACGRLGADSAEVTDGAWHAFRIGAAGANDMRRAVREASRTGPQEKQPMAPVVSDSGPVGRRRVVTGRLWPGDILWARTQAMAAGAVAADELRLAVIWRHPGWQADPGGLGDAGRWPARERVPEHLLACDDPGSLCPSCRMFGSADASGRVQGGPAQQRAYAGHVRFGDACSAEPVQLEEILRAPLGAPRAGAGQFYLAYADPSPAADRDDKPTREWGAAPDTTGPRQLRGRKFYWHADPARQDPPRHLARDHQKRSRMAVPQWLAPPGTRLWQQVSFDSLSPADLGGLLAALEPHRVLSAADGSSLRMHLGGGKPLGLGTCTATVSELRAWTAQSRYGTAAQVRPEPEAYVGDFASQCPAEVTATWPALTAVLAEVTADAERVWYPPGSRWSQRPGDPKKFDEPFAFFTASSGMYLKTKSRPLIPLPDPAAGDQRLPIKTKDDLE